MKIPGILLLICLIPAIVCGQLKQEIFEFEFEGIGLNGVLNLPDNSTPRGLVLIVHGSGQTNAVAEEWYYDIRKMFVESGYAVYMWDKMGSGKSGGTFNYTETVQLSAQEVIAAIKTLKKEQIPGSDTIGLWGISRAGWIIPLVINQYDGIKFWISVSGVDGKENFRYLLTKNLQINGHPKDTVDLLVGEWEKGVQITHSGGSFEAYREATPNLRKNAFFLRFMNGEITEQDYYSYQSSFMKQELDAESGLQMYIQDFETLLSNIDCPVLALFGEKDMNVDWTKTKLLYENTLGRNTILKIKTFPDCNHNFFKSKTGGFYEFEDNNLPWQRCDDFLNTMAIWLAELG